MKNYGLILDKEKDKNAYVLGGFMSLPKVVLQPNGQWDAYLPTREVQDEGYEKYNCTAYNTNACIETLFNRLGEKIEDRSDRYLGIKAGTKPPGNDPHRVAQAAHTHGLIAESTLPNKEAKTIGDYYTFKGSDALKCDYEAQDFLKKWEIGHEYLWDGKISKTERMTRMKEALTYSPLGISVSAWILKDGLYVDEGQPNNHWTMAFGYTDKGIKVFDSYDSTFKILSWDHNISVCKRYLLTKQATSEEVGIFMKMLQAISAYLTGLVSQPAVAPSPVLPVVEPVVEPRGSKLIEWALAIKAEEGYGTSRAVTITKNFNPGAIRSATGSFLKFPNYEAGFNYLLDYLTRAATGKHSAYRKGGETTLLEFQKIYSPSTDNNNPLRYATNVAKKLGVPVTEKIKNLV